MRQLHGFAILTSSFVATAKRYVATTKHLRESAKYLVEATKLNLVQNFKRRQAWQKPGGAVVMGRTSHISLFSVNDTRLSVDRLSLARLAKFRLGGQN